MTIQEILAAADANTKASLAQLFDQIQAIHDACTAKQNEVEKVDEHDAFATLLATTFADVPTALQACGALIANVNAKHAALLTEKNQALKDLRAQLA